MLIPIIKLALSGYLAASLCFFAFPSILHPKVKQYPLFEEAIKGKKIIRIAHRGGPVYGMENTIGVFDLCKQKVDMLEMDVCETKDGVLVVHHDKSLSRTCGVNKQVGEYLLQELPSFQEQVQMHFSEENKTMKRSSDGIPTLQAVFEKYSFLPMDIQIKTPSINAIKQIKRLILKYERIDMTLVGIVSPLQKQLKNIFPEGNRFFGYGTLPRLLLLYFTGLLPYCKIQQKALQIPLFSKDYQAMRTKLKGSGLSNKLFFWLLRGSYYLLLPLVWHLRRRGVMTFYWVCNREEEVRRAIEGQGCGVMTDDPEMLSKYLDKE